MSDTVYGLQKCDYAGHVRSSTSSRALLNVCIGSDERYRRDSDHRGRRTPSSLGAVRFCEIRRLHCVHVGAMDGSDGVQPSSQLMKSYVSSTLGALMSNVLRDHKTPYAGSWWVTQMVVIVYQLFWWTVGVLDIFLWMTVQLQFFLPAVVTELLVGVFTTDRYLSRKRLGDISQN